MTEQANYASVMAGAGKIDRAKGVIYGVAVMTMGEVEDRGLFVDRKTLDTLKACCERFSGGTKVKADHRSGVFATTAYLRNFRIEGQKLVADLYTLESDENRDKLMEMAEEIPDTFGLSVAITQELEEVGDKLCIRCMGVDSVDLVTEPAANPAGLFSAKVDALQNKTKPMKPEEVDQKLAAFETRFAALEDCFKKLTDKFSTATPSEEYAKGMKEIRDGLEAVKADFTTKLTAATEATATKVAAEFAKTIGTVIVKANPTETTGSNGGDANTGKLDEKFEALVQGHFAKVKNKSEAMSLAIDEDRKTNGGKGHDAFVAAKRSVRYEKAA